MLTEGDLDSGLIIAWKWGIMGMLLVVSIAAMTSFMTMVQLIALTLTQVVSPAQQSSVSSPVAGPVTVAVHTKRYRKMASRKSTAGHARRNGLHNDTGGGRRNSG